MKSMYEKFIKDSFPTSIEEDMTILSTKSMDKSMTSHLYFALIYWMENKKLILNQIWLVEVALRIIERIVNGWTFEFAVMWVYELEEKKQFYLNRFRMAGFLK